MMYVDIHTHSPYRKKDVLAIQNLFPAQVDQLSEGRPSTLGLHPWHVQKGRLDSDIGVVAEHATAKNVLAIGEIGLDKAIACPWKDQAEAFERQLEIAASEGKPVVLHCVRAYSEMLAYRKRSGSKFPWIFHWFNASLEMARALLEKNCYLSFGHMLFKENSKAYGVFEQLPLDRVFFETDDAGYSIEQVYGQAARIRGSGLAELKREIMKNFNRCFGGRAQRQQI